MRAIDDESQRPDFIKAEAEVKAGLLDGLVPNPPTTIPASLGESSGVYTEGSSPTGVVPEWTRPVPGEVPAGSGRAA
jgi:hypothetical protein